MIEMFMKKIGETVETAIKSNSIVEKISPKKTDSITTTNRLLTLALVGLVGFLLWERNKGKSPTYHRKYNPKFKTQYNFKNCSKEEVVEAIKAIGEQQKKIAVIPGMYQIKEEEVNAINNG